MSETQEEVVKSDEQVQAEKAATAEKKSWDLAIKALPTPSIPQRLAALVNDREQYLVISVVDALLVKYESATTEEIRKEIKENAADLFPSVPVATYTTKSDDDFRLTTRYQLPDSVLSPYAYSWNTNLSFAEAQRQRLFTGFVSIDNKRTEAEARRGKLNTNEA